MTAEQQRAPDRDDPYGISAYEPADRAGVLSLYERVFGGGEARFRWKYEDNPYVDHVPATVATRDGEVVAAAPAFALEVRIGENRLLAFKPADVMVDPEHRGAELRPRTRNRLLSSYEDCAPDVFFDLRGDGTTPDDGHDWEAVDELTTYYRLQRPTAIVGCDADFGARAAHAVSDPIAKAYLTARDALTATPEGFSVEHQDGVATRALLDAYRIERPGGIHALRDSRYYAWRFQNPGWSYETYAATVDEDVVAALVVGTRESDDGCHVSITEAVPLAGNERRTRVFGALLDRVVADNRDAGLLSISGDVLPRDLLASRGFLGDDAPPLAAAANQTTLLACPLTDEASQGIDGYDVTRATNWVFSYSERDTR